MGKVFVLFYIWFALKKELVCFVLQQTLCICWLQQRSLFVKMLASLTKGVFDICELVVSAA